MLDLVYENHTTYPELNEEIFRDILGIILKHFKMVQDQVEIGIQAVDEKTMRELNNEHRQKDKPTDVLSFPLDESNLRKYGIIALGDIFICPSYIEQKAKELEISFEEEIVRDVVHGFLHLIGYDHEHSESAEGEMIGLQEQIVKLIIEDK